LPVFKPCENGNASDPLIRGDVVEYELSAGYPGISVVDGTVDDPLVAGVVIGQGFDYSNITAGDFGILCVSGFCDRVTTDGSVDAGEILVAAASAVAKGSTTLVIGALGVALATDVSTDCAASVIRGLL
jgi:hypothetical protein